MTLVIPSTSPRESTQPISQIPGHLELVMENRRAVDILIPTKEDMIGNLLSYNAGDNLLVESDPTIQVRIMRMNTSGVESQSTIDVRINDLAQNNSFNAIIKFADIHKNGSIPLYKKEGNGIFKEVHIAPKGYKSRRNKSLYF